MALTLEVEGDSWEDVGFDIFGDVDLGLLVLGNGEEVLDICGEYDLCLLELGVVGLVLGIGGEFDLGLLVVGNGDFELLLLLGTVVHSSGCFLLGLAEEFWSVSKIECFKR